MLKKQIVIVTAGFITLAMPMLAQHPEMIAGVAANNRGDLPEAIRQFQSAVNAAPTLAIARMQLGSAHLRRVGSEPTLDNTINAVGEALKQFHEVLVWNPNDRLAIFQTACAYSYAGNFEESKKWFRRLIASNANDAEAHLALAYGQISEVARTEVPVQAVGARANDPGPVRDPVVRSSLRAKLLPMLNEAQQSLESAVRLDADDEDALGYLHYTHLRKADLADTAAENGQILQQASLVKQQLTTAKGRGKRMRSPRVLLNATQPPPPLAFVPAVQ